MQCLHSIKVFSVSHFVTVVSRLKVGKRLGGNTVGTADVSDERDIPHHVKLCSALNLGQG